MLRRTPVRLVFLLVVFLLVNAVVAAPMSALADTTSPVLAVLTLVLGVVLAGAALWVYRAVIGRVEHRTVTEVDPATAFPALRTGTLLGLGLFTAVMALMAVFGGFDSIGWGSVWASIATAGLMIAVAVVEEILFRAVLFRVLEHITGTVGALIGSAVVFGGLHLVNENATIWGAIAIAIQAGLMLGAVYAVTRTLWLPIGLHLGWNFAQAGIFGARVSGSDSGSAGLLKSTFDGPTAITGGSFGPEASLLSIAVCLVLAVVYLRRMKPLTSAQARENAPA